MNFFSSGALIICVCVSIQTSVFLCWPLLGTTLPPCGQTPALLLKLSETYFSLTWFSCYENEFYSWVLLKNTKMLRPTDNDRQMKHTENELNMFRGVWNPTLISSNIHLNTSNQQSLIPEPLWQEGRGVPANQVSGSLLWNTHSLISFDRILIVKRASQLAAEGLSTEIVTCCRC